MNRTTARYLERHGTIGPWRIEGDNAPARAIIVIPALAEENSLFATLGSLSQCSPQCLEETLVLVVVNQSPETSPQLSQDNLRTLTRLQNRDELPPGLRLAWIDAASPGLELPRKNAGVGLARRIGMDLALERLDHENDPFLVCLDADCLVEPTYLDALFDHFNQHHEGGAVLPFAHQRALDSAIEAAIVRYELYLRHYVLGLSLAGSPWAFHSIGSAMACRRDAYCAVGGMVKRQAGEDFYFLQKLAKASGLRQLRGTCVHPSPRPSQRTPFGTGASVGKLLTGDDSAVLFYPIESFEMLSEFLRLSAPLGSPGEILRAATGVSPLLHDYLDLSGFEGAWTGILKNHPTDEHRRRAFHEWFDGFRTLKLIHHFCSGHSQRCPPEGSIPHLLQRAGLAFGEGQQEWLETLRIAQN